MARPLAARRISASDEARGQASSAAARASLRQPVASARSAASITPARGASFGAPEARRAAVGQREQRRRAPRDRDRPSARDRQDAAALRPLVRSVAARASPDTRSPGSPAGWRPARRRTTRVSAVERRAHRRVPFAGHRQLQANGFLVADAQVRMGRPRRERTRRQRRRRSSSTSMFRCTYQRSSPSRASSSRRDVVWRPRQPVEQLAARDPVVRGRQRIEQHLAHSAGGERQQRSRLSKSTGPIEQRRTAADVPAAATSCAAGPRWRRRSAVLAARGQQRPAPRRCRRRSR